MKNLSIAEPHQDRVAYNFYPKHPSYSLNFEIMTTSITRHFCFLAIVFSLYSCSGPTNKSVETASDGIASKATLEIDSNNVLENKVLSQEEQVALSPEAIIKILKAGNADFVSDRLTVRNNSQRVRQAAMGQFPKAVILSCMDSRVPVEDVFHRGIGDIFVGRVAGNIINEDQLGSMEYACKVSGAKVVLILGHEHCGAVKSAIDDVKLGNITALLSKIRPAVTSAKFDGEKSSKNEAFVHAVCEQNVRLAVENVRKRSPILAEMEKNKKLIIQGGVYDMDSGVVTFLN